MDKVSSKKFLKIVPAKLKVKTQLSPFCLIFEMGSVSQMNGIFCFFLPPPASPISEHRWREAFSLTNWVILGIAPQWCLCHQNYTVKQEVDSAMAKIFKKLIIDEVHPTV